MVSNKRKEGLKSTKGTKESKKDKSALSRRCTLLQAGMLQAKTFSSYQTRIALNNAFKAKGI